MATRLAQQARGPGLIQTGSINVGGVVQPDTLYSVTALMDTADMLDPTLTIDFTLELDGVIVRSGTWTGGATDRNGNPSPLSFDYSTGEALPSAARATATLSRRINFGVDVSLDTIAAAFKA